MSRSTAPVNHTAPALATTPVPPAPSPPTSTEPVVARKRRRRRHRHRRGAKPVPAGAVPNQATPLVPSEAPPLTVSTATTNGHVPEDAAPRLLQIDPEEIRERVGEEVVLFRRRTAGPSRFVLRECFE